MIDTLPGKELLSVLKLVLGKSPCRGKKDLPFEEVNLVLIG
jgi:hypothetical protein